MNKKDIVKALSKWILAIGVGLGIYEITGIGEEPPPSADKFAELIVDIVRHDEDFIAKAEASEPITSEDILGTELSVVGEDPITLVGPTNHTADVAIPMLERLLEPYSLAYEVTENEFVVDRDKLSNLLGDFITEDKSQLHTLLDSMLLLTGPDGNVVGAQFRPELSDQRGTKFFEALGFEANDLIYAINGEFIVGPEAFWQLVMPFLGGEEQEIFIDVDRNGVTRQVKYIL